SVFRKAELQIENCAENATGRLFTCAQLPADHTRTIFPAVIACAEGDVDHMSLRTLHDRVLITRIEEQETVKGGIIIPDTAKEKSQEGEVIAVGIGKRLEDGTVVPPE